MNRLLFITAFLTIGFAVTAAELTNAISSAPNQTAERAVFKKVADSSC